MIIKGGNRFWKGPLRRQYFTPRSMRVRENCDLSCAQCLIWKASVLWLNSVNESKTCALCPPQYICEGVWFTKGVVVRRPWEICVKLAAAAGPFQNSLCCVYLKKAKIERALAEKAAYLRQCSLSPHKDASWRFSCTDVVRRCYRKRRSLFLTFGTCICEKCRQKFAHYDERLERQFLYI